MGENVSTVMKVSVLMLLMSFCVSIAISVLSVSVGMEKNLMEPVYNMSSVVSQNLYKVSLEESISAPVAYKILKQNEECVQSLSITINGITYSGMSKVSVLLTNASKNVSISLTENSLHGYDVVIKEVTR